MESHSNQKNIRRIAAMEIKRAPAYLQTEARREKLYHCAAGTAPYQENFFIDNGLTDSCIFTHFGIIIVSC